MRRWLRCRVSGRRRPHSSVLIKNSNQYYILFQRNDINVSYWKESVRHGASLHAVSWRHLAQWTRYRSSILKTQTFKISDMRQCKICRGKKGKNAVRQEKTRLRGTRSYEIVHIHYDQSSIRDSRHGKERRRHLIALET